MAERDPEWMKDAVSKFLQSPVYSVPLLDFIDENCGMFEDCDENKLEYTIVHENFKQLVDGLISDFLTNLGVPVHQFVQMLANEMHASLYSIVVTSILTVDDFLLFKEMMLKRNNQLNSQAMTQMTNQAQVLDEPADLNSVILHLSEMSKQQQQSDSETAKSLSLVAAFQQQATVTDVRSNPTLDPLSLSLALEEEKQWQESHHSQGAQLRQKCNEQKEKAVHPQHLREFSKEGIEPPATPENHFQHKQTGPREFFKQPITEPTPSPFEDDRRKQVGPKQQAVQDCKPATKSATGSENPMALPLKENMKENTAPRTKVSFEKAQKSPPRGPAALAEVKPVAVNGLGWPGDKANGTECARVEGDGKAVDGAREETESGQDVELGTSKMMSKLMADDWKPASLKLNVNDGEIQQRRRYLQQQRDRILAHKKAAREKQLKYFRRLDSKLEGDSDALPLQHTRRLAHSTGPSPTSSQDSEANRRREMLRKDLARRLKDELTNKNAAMSPVPHQVHV